MIFNKAIIIIGANSQIFKIYSCKLKHKNYDFFLFSKINPNLNFNYTFHHWYLNKKFSIPGIEKYKNIKLLIFAHDWKNYNFEYHIKSFKKLIHNINDIEKKIKIKKKCYISSFSSNVKAENFYGKIKYLLEENFKKNNYQIIRISLIVGSNKFFHYKKLKENSKKKIVFIPKSKEKFQIIHINDLCNKMSKILESKKKEKIYNLGSKKSYTLKELINKFSNKSFPKYLEINLSIILFILRLFVFIKFIDYRFYDSVKGLKKQFYVKEILS
jgi:hypothetical protein